MKNKILIFLYSVFIIIISFSINYFFIESFSYIYFWFQLISLLSILLLYSFFAIKEKNIVQPIIIFNALIIFMFFLRPIVLVHSSYSSIVATSNSLRTYSFLHNIFDISSYPIHYLNNIIIVGAFFLNFGYFRFEKIFSVSSKKFEYNNLSINNNGLILLSIIIVASMLYFFSRYNYSTLLHSAGRFSIVGIDFSTIDILWAYLFPFLISYYYFLSYKNDGKPIYALFLSIVYIFLIMCISRRYFVVNLFIMLFMISFYSKKENKFNIKYLFILLAMFAVVLVYANVRGSNINKVQESSVFLKVLSEFDMYDMLLCSLHRIFNIGSFNYHGFNYLSFPFIPRFIWYNKPVYFDVYHTYTILNGIIHGGIPTSIIGSFYLNFGILGVTFFCYLFGYIFSKIYRKIYPFNSIYSIIFYSLIISFSYDIFRVGDIGREIWTFTVYFVCFYFSIFFAFKNRRDLR